MKGYHYDKNRASLLLFPQKDLFHDISFTLEDDQHCVPDWRQWQREKYAGRYDYAS